MARGKRYQPEQVVNLLRQIEVAVANGKTTAQACKEAEIAQARRFVDNISRSPRIPQR